ncbi:MAG: DUF2357 domain-containing protein [Methyloprofundus sp.]|nr:DUF2357 domain-containing protein [Methyloprofundus sp.]
MPELLKLETPDWTLVVWSKNIEPAQAMLKRTLKARNKPCPVSCLHFEPLLQLEAPLNQYTLDEAIFFENKLYEFDFQFQSGRDINAPTISHRLKSIEDAFHYSGNSLRGSLNFSNHIGWFKWVLTYQQNKKQIVQAISFEVLATKMDSATDLISIQQVIDKDYPLLRFSFAQPTEQALAQSNKPYERFPLLWLAQFESLRLELEKGLKQILQAPHSRLLPKSRKLRAEQLKGRLSPRLEAQLKTAVNNAEVNRRYTRDHQVLSLDTPENRFIKMVLIRCTRELSAFITRVKDINTPPEKARISASFFKQLNAWKKPLEQYLKRPFFREVGHYEGLNNESLVLHQKAGYANVYRVWQQLKLYLDVFGRHANISIKSVAELYEVWCVLEVRRLLIEDLGFVEQTSRKPSLYKKGVEKGLHEGMGAAFELYREADNLTIKLAHEPRFSKPQNNKPESGKIYSWITGQKPDIFLEAEFSQGETVRWIFDAKYQISAEGDIDLAKDDAINQMHRYRDALIYVHQADDEWQEKTRPIFGAFVLYPGYFADKTTDNPYHDAITEIGIGAFPLLPNAENTCLRNFLIEQFGLPDKSNYLNKSADHLYIKEAARISYTGMQLSRYQDLTLAVALGAGRSDSYIEAFRQGKAQWYHLPETTAIKKKVPRAVMREIKYCAFWVYDTHSKQRQIKYLYELKSVRLVQRQAITKQQAGTIARHGTEFDNYWLLELGQAHVLNNALTISGSRDFKFKLINREELVSTGTSWEHLSGRYLFLNSQP